MTHSLLLDRAKLCSPLPGPSKQVADHFAFRSWDRLDLIVESPVQIGGEVEPANREGTHVQAAKSLLILGSLCASWID